MQESGQIISKELKCTERHKYMTRKETMNRLPEEAALFSASNSLTFILFSKSLITLLAASSLKETFNH